MDFYTLLMNLLRGRCLCCACRGFLPTKLEKALGRSVENGEVEVHVEEEEGEVSSSYTPQKPAPLEYDTTDSI